MKLPAQISFWHAKFKSRVHKYILFPVPFCFHKKGLMGEYLGFPEDMVFLKNDSLKWINEKRGKEKRKFLEETHPFCNMSSYMFTDQGIGYSFNALPLSQLLLNDLSYSQEFYKQFRSPLDARSGAQGFLHPTGSGVDQKMTLVLDLHSFRGGRSLFDDGKVKKKEFKIHLHKHSAIPGCFTLIIFAIK